MTTDSEGLAEKTTLKRVLEVGIRIGLLLLLIVWCFEIVKPFIVPVIWGIVISTATYPGYRRLEIALGGRGGIAATLFTLLMLVVLVGPTLLLGGTLVEGVRGLEQHIQAGTLRIPLPPDSVADWPIIGPSLAAFWTLASENLAAALGKLGPQLRTVGLWLLSALSGAGLGLLQFIFAIIISGIFLAYSRGSGKAAQAIASRLMGEQGIKYADLALATVRGVARGILGVALIQSILAGLGFLAVGLPAAGLLAMLCLILAIIQLGVGLILIPAAIYVFATADTLTAVVFLVWSIFVTLLDNVLKPILLGRGSKVPMAVIFIGAIGGFLAHGIVGLFVGAVVLAVGYALFVTWLGEGAKPAKGASSAAAPGIAEGKET